MACSSHVPVVNCRNVIIHALLPLLILMPTQCVDRANFKTCDQSSFCRRQRNTQPGKSPYIILLDSVQVSNEHVHMHILNTENDIRFLLQLSYLRDNTARLKINELNPLKPRYEVPIDLVLDGELKFDSLKLEDRNSNTVTVRLGSNTVVLTSKPLRIDILQKHQPVISFNAQGLFNFEHLRHKSSQKSEDKAPDVGQQQDEKKEGEEEKLNEDKFDEVKKDQEGMWEETFGSHRDSKPNGPTSIGIDVSFPGFEHVYGIPEHADSFALRSTKDTEPYRLFNLDVFEYILDSPMALYGSIPYLIAHNKDRTVGMLWLNAAEMWIDVRSNIADKTFFSKLATFVSGDSDVPQIDTHWIAESGIVDLFFFLGPDHTSVMKQYSQLTGSTPLPPLFAISYHQCRWNYIDQEDVLTVDKNFDIHDIPYDVIWLDIEHTDGKRYFTWDSYKFPDPPAMLETLNQKGRKLVNVVDPHLKRDDDFSHYAEAKSRNLFVKDRDGSDYEGWCWSGSSCWPDFTNPEAHKWWSEQFTFDRYKHSAPNLFIWNDMNEPSVFSGPEITMHKDNLHYGGWENRDLHNYFALAHHSSTWKGLLARSNPPRRPFVLTRGFFIGSQKFGAVWTGDNLSDWPHLKVSIPMLLTLSLSGISFCGADVGGFFKNPTPDLLTRWYQAAAFQPFIRSHAHIDTNRREPWLMPKHNMEIIREAVKTRYSFLPYWYTLFYHNEVTGIPPMRAMWLEYPKDESVFSMDDQYMLGSSLLVKPVVEHAVSSISVYLPGSDEVWYDIDDYTKYDGSSRISIQTPLHKIPVFQRGGAIVPRRLRHRRSSALTYNDPFTLIVTLDNQGKASGDLYVDDYNTFDYRSGQYIHKLFTATKDSITSKDYREPGSFVSKAWVERIIVAGLSHAPQSIHISSRELQRKQPLVFTFSESNHLLVIRKPGVNIADDWQINIQ